MPAPGWRLGLPPQVRACLFDLDGVLTQTATVHAAAWKEMFDEFLSGWLPAHGQPMRPFDPQADYAAYVDGRPRDEGTREFLRSRGIELPEGGPDDPPSAATVHALSTRKNDLVAERIRRDGVATFAGSVRYLAAVREAGLATAVVSSSANTRSVLEATGLAGQFDVRVDGVTAAERGLAGKPRPDTFLAAAADLHLQPGAAAVFEDAQAGVAAGRAGNFGRVIGVDRGGQADALRRAGADVVVGDLAELLDDGGRSV